MLANTSIKFEDCVKKIKPASNEIRFKMLYYYSIKKIPILQSMYNEIKKEIRAAKMFVSLWYYNFTELVQYGITEIYTKWKI